MDNMVSKSVSTATSTASTDNGTVAMENSTSCVDIVRKKPHRRGAGRCSPAPDLRLRQRQDRLAAGPWCADRRDGGRVPSRSGGHTLETAHAFDTSDGGGHVSGDMHLAKHGGVEVLLEVLETLKASVSRRPTFDFSSWRSR